MTETLAPNPPYPPDTKVNGYRPEIDWQVIRSSKTWRICPQTQKNNLLRIWLESWNEVPSGSWENDEELIAAAVDMPLEDLIQYRSILLRGWKLHSDGRLYHPYITTMILEMIGKRMVTTRRVQRWRDKQTQKEGVTRYNDYVTRYNDDVTGYNEDVTRYQRVGNASEQEQEQETGKEEEGVRTEQAHESSASRPERPSRATRASRTPPACCPENWEPGPKACEWITSIGLTIDAARPAIIEFRSYWSSTGKRYSNWDLAFMRNGKVESSLRRLAEGPSRYPPQHRPMDHADRLITFGEDFL